MPVSLEYKDYILDLLSPIDGMTMRPMFAGIGLFMEGITFGIIGRKAWFYFKVDEYNRKDFEDAGSGPFKPHADGSVTIC